MSQLMALLLALPPALVLAAALVLPALEASTLLGLVVPGETAVFVAGVMAHGGRLPLWGVVLAAASGAVLGDQIGFVLGRRWGPALVDHLPRRLRGSVQVDQSAAILQRYGGWAVVLGRWTALLRALIPGLAGAGGLRRRTFVIANVVGGSTWAALVAVLGYAAGSAYQQVSESVGRVGQLALLGVVAAVLTVVVFRRSRRRRVRIALPGPALGKTAPPAGAPEGSSRRGGSHA